jgi:hypothetical protein
VINRRSDRGRHISVEIDSAAMLGGKHGIQLICVEPLPVAAQAHRQHRASSLISSLDRPTRLTSPRIEAAPDLIETGFLPFDPPA